MEPVIKEKVARLTHLFENASLDSSTIHLEAIFAATTADIITHYAYGVDFNFLEEKGFKNDIHAASDAIVSLCHISRFFPFLQTLANLIPVQMVQKFFPKSAAIINMQQSVRHMGIDALRNENPKIDRATIFSALADPSIPAEEKTPDRLQDEGFTILAAGTETTSRVLAAALFYVANDKSVLHKLREELRQVMPTPHSTASWSQLEVLPYMVCIRFTSILYK